MALALEMGLDRAGDQAIRDLWSRLEQLGVPSLQGHVPSIRPHLSLTVTDDADGLRQQRHDRREQRQVERDQSRDVGGQPRHSGVVAPVTESVRAAARRRARTGTGDVRQAANASATTSVGTPIESVQ